MKRLLLISIGVLLLCGCGAGAAKENRILVCIEETDGCTVENNGQLVSPGEDVTFSLQLDYGFALSTVDYAGDYFTEVQRRTVQLTLRNVTYPTRAVLGLTSKYCTITYEANGGAPLRGTETAVKKNYDLSIHRRPNTEQGTRLFTRDGYTLLCWNTRPDGSGERIGLGSRVTVTGRTLTLYAQWVPWSDAGEFIYESGDTVAITGCRSTDSSVAVPGYIDGRPVTRIASGAFDGCGAESLILPDTLLCVEEGAFSSCAFREVTMFDNLEEFGDSAFEHCDALRTLYINAVEAPYGNLYRKESCYADKVDLMILTKGKPRLIFYGGCSTWYNLDGLLALKTVGDKYSVVNMGLNGTIDSSVQMQIIGAYLEAGDIFFHTPELSSRQQMMLVQDMTESGDILWCGLERNYDLFSLVDLRRVSGALDSLRNYLDRKDRQGSYQQDYADSQGYTYTDPQGCIPFFRSAAANELSDAVSLDPGKIDGEAMDRLQGYYDWYLSMGVRIYVSYACVNMDAVPEEQRGNTALMDGLFRSAIEEMGGPVLISRLQDYLYRNEDFYDTNYHLNTEPARENTARWLNDLLAQMEQDGLWEASS